MTRSLFPWLLACCCTTTMVQGRFNSVAGIHRTKLAFTQFEPHGHRRQLAIIRHEQQYYGDVHHNKRKERVARFLSTITTEADRITSIPENTASEAYPYDRRQQQQQQFVTVPQPSTDGFGVNSLSILQLAVCGGLASMLGDVVMHPIDCIKTLQQSDSGMGLNVWNAAQLLFQQSGVAGFYHGLWTYAGTDVFGSALKFASYEGLKRWAQPRLPHTSTRHYLPARFGVMLVCAALSFIASSFILVPGELLKQQLQMGYYDHVGDALQGLFHQAGNSILGLYVGYEGVLLRDVPYTMLELSLYDLLPLFYTRLRAMLTPEDGNEDEAGQIMNSSWQQEVVAAGLAGGITAFLTTPLDTIKTKLMVDGYASFWDCYQTIVDLYGWDSLWSGSLARVGWLVPLTAIYLPTYEFLKRQMAKSNNSKVAQAETIN